MQNNLYIEDSNQTRLFYRFTPAAITSNFVPLVVILDDEKMAGDIYFEYKMWNILTPTLRLDNKEDFAFENLLQKLIHQIAEDYECEEHIYLYGSSSRGYEAILQGILCKVNAVFAHTDDIKIAQISNLSNLLNATDSFPIFYLCGNEIEKFTDACKKHSIKFHLDFCPQAKEEVLDMFERMTS